MNKDIQDRLTGVNQLSELVKVLREEYDGPVCVMGNGPSILDLDKDKLDEMLTIGVNRISRFYAPHILIRTESDWFIPESMHMKNEMSLSESPVKLVPDNRGHTKEDILFRAAENLSIKYTGKLFMNQTVITAMHLAMMIEPEAIYLAGVDMYGLNTTETYTTCGDKDCNNPSHIKELLHADHFYDAPEYKDMYKDVKPVDSEIVLMERPDGQPAIFGKEHAERLIKKGFRKVEFGDVGLIAERMGALKDEAALAHNASPIERQTPYFSDINNICQRHGINIYNCSTHSKLNVFPKTELLNTH